ncbi:MAG TPA: FmdB family zinc ribbon protein [Candidatus Limnocylindria bacterium]
MPIYDYLCDHCGHAFSAVQSFTDAVIETCPNCGKRPRKLFVPPAIVFKGSGWYKTDSRTAPKSDAGASGSSKGETKTETKSEPKAEAKPAKSEGSS